MGQKGKKSGGFYLKWPWNVVVYVLLAVMFRIFAIPLIMAVMAWNKKQQPNGPEEGYCLQRTRQRLIYLLWALLFFVIGGCCMVVCVAQFLEDRSGWDMMDYAVLVVSGAIGSGGLIAGVYETYTNLRDVFFPEKSRLAKSIRSQMPYPDEAPEVGKLFAMVDADIRENGRWFDRVAVGNEWVLGDEASKISRIRAVFGRDETIYRTSGGRTQTRRILELYILDDRRQTQMTGLRKPAELQALLEYLEFKAPEAEFYPYDEYHSYRGKSDEEWQRIERRFRARRDERLEREALKERAAAGSNTAFTFRDSRGQRTSRFTAEDIRREFGGLSEGGQSIALEPVELVENGRERSLSRLEAVMTDENLILAAVFKNTTGAYQAYGIPVAAETACAAFLGLLEHQSVPDISGWPPVQFTSGRPQANRTNTTLTLTEKSGSTRDYRSFTHRDVELAAEGLESGKYQTIVLSIGARYLYLEAGTVSDGRITANASLPMADDLHVFEIKCSHTQAKKWLLDMAGGRFLSDFSDWKDVTKKLQSKLKKER
ncbi:MAG: hypothetical protein HFE84_04655 [Lachnospiraceae bacterium]|nr:hypothetical protein [Lachnospiraceae bacterium]